MRRQRGIKHRNYTLLWNVRSWNLAKGAENVSMRGMLVTFNWSSVVDLTTLAGLPVFHSPKDGVFNVGDQETNSSSFQMFEIMQVCCGDIIVVHKMNIRVWRTKGAKLQV